jgi:hypothetical protein
MLKHAWQLSINFVLMYQQIFSVLKKHKIKIKKWQEM